MRRQTIVAMPTTKETKPQTAATKTAEVALRRVQCHVTNEVTLLDARI